MFHHHILFTRIPDYASVVYQVTHWHCHGED